MDTVGAYEAKTHLNQLLKKVEQGHTIIITKHGKAIAKLSPAVTVKQTDYKQLSQQIKAFRKGKSLNGLTIKDLITEGRK